MKSLSESILLCEYVKDIEEILEPAIMKVELIGQLDIDEKAYRHIGKILHQRCREGQKIRTDFLKPATFITSMIFSARYDNSETRNFWGPYAEKVWGIPFDNNFRTMCSKYFKESCSKHFRETFGIYFPLRSDGDIVHAVYRHVVLPSYLYDDFASWLKKRIRHIKSLDKAYLTSFLSDQTQTQNVATRLKSFLQDTETQQIAVEFIEELLTALELLKQKNNEYEHDNAEFIRLFSSPMHRQLWKELIAETIDSSNNTDGEQDVISRRTRLEWTWSFEEEDWVLRVVSFFSDSRHKPNLCIWSKYQDGENARQELRSDSTYSKQQLFPEGNKRSGWLVREIELRSETIVAASSVVHIYDDNGYAIFSQPVPPLPNANWLIYRITQQKAYAIPVPVEEISNGTWLISAKTPIRLTNANGEEIQPPQRYIASDTMREGMGHSYIAEYHIQLPSTLYIDKDIIALSASKTRYLAQPYLQSEGLLDTQTRDIPPVYNTTKIAVVLPELNDAWLRSIEQLTLTLTSGNYIKRVPLGERWEDNRLYRDLSDLLITDKPATYQLDITQGFKSRLPAPLEFSVVPNIEIIPPEGRVYSPLQLPKVKLRGLTATQEIILPSDTGSVALTDNGEVIVTWDVSQNDECHLLLRDGTHVVPISWKIKRLWASIENTKQKGFIFDDDKTSELIEAELKICGEPYQKVILLIEGDRHEIKLNARGQYETKIGNNQLMDIIRDKRGTNVSIQLELAHGDIWTIANVVREAQVLSLDIIYILDEENKGTLVADIILSKELKTELTLCLEHQVSKNVNYYPLQSLRHVEFEDKLDVGSYIAFIQHDGKRLNGASQALEIKASSLPPEAISLLRQQDKEDGKLTKEGVYYLLTCPLDVISQNIQEIALQWKSLIPLAFVKQPEIWIRRYDYLPTWCLLQHPLVMTTHRGREFLVYPEVIADKGYYGKGKILLNTPEAGKLFAYARWSREKDTTVDLEVAIPDEEPKIYSSLDEDDLRPAYYDLTIDRIRGQRGSYINPRSGQVVDIIHNYKLLMRVKQIHHPLYHTIKPNQSVDRSVITHIKENNFKAIKAKAGNPVTSEYYRYALVQSFTRFHDSEEAENGFKRLLGKDSIVANKTKDFVKQLNHFIEDGRTQMSLLYSLWSLLQKLEDQFSTDKAHPMARLDEQLLVLALAARSGSLSVNNTMFLKNQHKLTEDELKEALFDAYRYAPELLSWAVIWIEIFIHHAAEV